MKIQYLIMLVGLFILSIFVVACVFITYKINKMEIVNYPKARVVCNNNFKYSGTGGNFDGEYYIENTGQRDKVKPFGNNCILFVRENK